MNRRAFIAGLMSLVSAGTQSAAAPLTGMDEEPGIDRMVEFFERWSRLDDDQRGVFLDLLRELAALPDGADDGPLYAGAHARLAELRRPS